MKALLRELAQANAMLDFARAAAIKAQIAVHPEGASAPSALYSCGRCTSGAHSADMSLAEAMKHAALVHDRPVRRPILPLAVRP